MIELINWQNETEHTSNVWGGSYDSDLYKLEQVHIDAMRLITGATAKSNIAKLYEDTRWQTLKDRRDYNMLVMVYKIKNNLAPSYLFDLLPPETREYTTYNLRNGNNIALPVTRLEAFKRSFIPYSIRLWNRLPHQIRTSPSLSVFKSHLAKDKKDPYILYYYSSRWPLLYILLLNAAYPIFFMVKKLFTKTKVKLTVMKFTHLSISL